MLKIIRPQGQIFHLPTIEAFLDLLKVYQNFEISNRRRKKATFLIAKDEKHGVYGGAVLYSQKVYEAEEDIRQDPYEDTFCGAFATFRPQIQEFWIAKICFCLEANFSLDGLEGMEICEKFYTELCEAFKDFGKSKKIEFLAFSLCSFDTNEPPFHKKWLYSPVWRSDDASGLAHGILSITKKKFMPVKKRQPKIAISSLKQDKCEPSSQERAS